ncbi:MAG TPA: alpha/beta fold hydrolase [Polyangiaceae bacterium]|jgi:carboxylesterase|nr:alpha/beta fold hydrolase [Polyangiaceae bacterium]
MRADRGALHGDGDSSPVRVAGAEPAVLAFHGYGGTPFEVRLVTEAAKDAGLEAYAPLLPGHGTNARDLAKTRFDDWLGGAETALDSVLGTSRKVIVVGLSLGSLIAAHLAWKHPDEVVGLGMLANATRLSSPFPTIALKIVDRLKLPDFSLPKASSDIGDPEARASHVSYGLQPVRAAIEVLRAGERTEKILGQITVPALVAHGQHDLVCPVANAERVMGLLGSRDKSLLILPRSHHIITRDYDREVLRRALTKFFVHVAAGHRATAAQTPVEP